MLNRLTHERLYNGAGAQDRVQTHAYNGLTATTTDFKSNASSRVLTAWGDIAQVSDAAGKLTKYQHDVFGQLAEVRDHFNNLVIGIGYNIRGMKTSSIDMDMGSWSYTPNALGEVVSQINAKSQNTSFAYDALGRMTSRVEVEGTTTLTWGNSAGSFNIGELASVTSPGYSETLTYDNKSRLTQRNITTDTSYQVNFGYHAQTGFVDTMTYPVSTSGVRFQLKYDYTFGKLSAVKRNDAGAPTTQYWTLNSVDPRGNVMDETLGNGMQVVSTYSPLTGTLEERAAGWSGSWTIQDLEYDWDNNWNLTERRDVRQSITESFLYDALDRVTRATVGANVVNFDYDEIGNIKRKSDVHTGTNSYIYHATQKHALTAIGSPAVQSFGYDANGNMSMRNGSPIVWTSYNLPATINGSGVSSVFSYGPDASASSRSATTQAARRPRTTWAGSSRRWSPPRARTTST
ncbi:MAG: RHS repeat protein [Gammaproteobacteria bacterium]|nr:RHS repeat protein [Gammaproteobacteria bacterium]